MSRHASARPDLAHRWAAVLWAGLVAASLLLSLVAVGQPNATRGAAGDITTVAGGLGSGSATNLSMPTSFLSVHGSSLYLSDESWNVVREVNVGTDAASVVAGTGEYGFGGDGGQATSAHLNYPGGTAVDSAGNIYIADRDNNAVRRVDAATGAITTVAGTGDLPASCEATSASAPEVAPYDVALNADGTELYIVERFCARVRRVTLSTGLIELVAGTGVSGYNGDGSLGITAQLNVPSAVAVDASGDTYISDTYNHRIRRVDRVTGTITTVAGTGTAGNAEGDGGGANSAQLNYPAGLTTGPDGDIYVADEYNFRIRRFDPEMQAPGGIASPGPISTVTGDGTWEGDCADPASDNLCDPTDVAVAANGTVYIADRGASLVRRVDRSGLPAVAGNGHYAYGGDGGPALAAQFSWPAGLAFGPGSGLHVADSQMYVIRRISTAGVVSTVAGAPGEYGDAAKGLLDTTYDVAFDSAGSLYIATYGLVYRQASSGALEPVAGTISESDEGGPVDGGVATDTPLCPRSIAFDEEGDLYLADACGNRVWRVDLGTGLIHVLAGTGDYGFSGDDGPAPAAELRTPLGLALDGTGNIFFTDSYNCRVRRVDAATRVITTVAGSDTQSCGRGEPSSASESLTTTSAHDAEPATEADLSSPDDVAVDALGNLFIADAHLIRRVDAKSGQIATIAGTGDPGFAGDGGDATQAQLRGPSSLTIGPDGDLYISDAGNSRIRELDLPLLPSDLVVGMQLIGPTQPTVGSPTAFRIGLQNIGPVDATNVVLKQEIPAGWQFQSASTGAGSCSVAGSTITCPIGGLSVGEPVTMNSTLVPTTAGTSTHTASAFADQPDPVLGNNARSLQVVVQPAPCTTCGPATGAPTPTPTAGQQLGGTSPTPTPVAQFVPGTSSPAPTQAVLGSQTGTDKQTDASALGGVDKEPQPTPDAAPTPTPEATAEPVAVVPTGSPPPDEGEAPILPEDPVRFGRSVPALGDISLDFALLGQSALIAAAVMLLMLFPAELFNNTLEAHHDEVRGWFAPLAVGIRSMGDALDEFWRTPYGILVFLIASALLYALLDPTFGLSLDGVVTVVGLAAGLAVVAMISALPLVLVHRRSAGRPIVAALPISLVVGVVCVLISRLADFQPGYVYGLIIGVVFARELRTDEEGRSGALAAAVMLVAVVAAFFGLGVLRGTGVDGIGPTILETALAVIAVAGLEQVVFSLVPLRFMPGASIYTWNRIAWAALFVLALFAFFHILINPASGYLSDSSRTGVLTSIALVGAFGLVSVAFWGYFRFRPERPARPQGNAP